jgi:hypothetical protein
LPGPVPAPARAGHQPGRALRRRKTAAAAHAISDYYQQQYQRPAPCAAIVRCRSSPAAI